jgi:poly-gamma-glutamate capsule biosynthesis protein CapA/YwtB (metallophosphatase superfamily)
MQPITVFLCGDVMTGRGIDQILQRPSDPAIHEFYMRSALDYVALAEREHGAIPRRVPPEYIWGDALAELERVRPAARIVNLETAVTAGNDWADKGINYRMHPANVDCLAAAAIDCCALANNHVLDWGRAGLEETLDTLHAAGIRTAGAGRDSTGACSLATIALADGGRVLVRSFCTASSGVPRHWAATAAQPGVDVIDDLTDLTVERIGRSVAAVKREGDLVVASVHWGDNWGYAIGSAERRFAHRLIDAAGVDVVHGHSSHHPKALEVHAGKLILYGCGDFLNDYEGIDGHTSYRGDLGAMYFPTLRADSGELLRLDVVPTQVRNFRVRRATGANAQWLAQVLDRESRALGAQAHLREDGSIGIGWNP